MGQAQFNIGQFLNTDQMKALWKSAFPEGTKLFVGINLRMEDGEWKQQGAFAKVQAMKKATKKKVETKRNVEDKAISKAIKTTKIEEEDAW